MNDFCGIGIGKKRRYLRRLLCRLISSPVSQALLSFFVHPLGQEDVSETGQLRIDGMSW